MAVPLCYKSLKTFGTYLIRRHFEDPSIASSKFNEFPDRPKRLWHSIDVPLTHPVNKINRLVDPSSKKCFSAVNVRASPEFDGVSKRRFFIMATQRKTQLWFCRPALNSMKSFIVELLYLYYHFTAELIPMFTSLFW